MGAIHPGEILKDQIEALGISATAFSKKLAVPPSRITTILNGERGITANTALRLARFFRTTPELWLNLQTAYELQVAVKKDGKRIQAEISRISIDNN